MKKVANLVLVLTLLTGWLAALSAPVQAQGSFDCSTATGLPQTECEALVALYNATDGDNWHRNTDWLQTTTPCSWYGVTCQAERVTQLSLGYNNLSGELPVEIGNLTALTTLQLGENQLTSLPAEIGNLVVLDWLSLSRNQLISLPAEIGNLTALTGLWLYGNQLTALPPELWTLTGLSHLDLGYNQLTAVPPEIGNLTGLVYLDLSVNQLTNLPAEIWNLIALEYLYLQHNQLSSVLAEIGNLTALMELSLAYNQLTSVPAEIGSLTELTYLNLEDNQLTFVPPEIGNLTKLQHLYLSHNQLTSVPSEIGSLAALWRLDLGNNQLTSIPAEVGNLTELSGLNLNNNQLTSIPPEIGNLTLWTLDLASNQLTSLPPEIGLTGVTEDLVLRDNQLTSLPPEIGNLTTLMSLNLGGNQLTSLPPEIGNLTALSGLGLDDNQLTSLPPEIGNLTALSLLWLHDNPLSGQVQADLTSLTSLSIFTFYETDWCVPTTGAVPAWLAGITEVYGTGQVCGQAPGSLSGSVTRPDANPAAGVQVDLYRNVVSWHHVTTTHTLADGSYQVDGLGQGIDYRVQFIDPAHQYAPEYYDDQPTLDLATPVTVTLGATRTGIDAVLNLPQPPLAEVETDGGSVTPNPLDGTATINMAAGNTGAITVTRVVTCAIGSPSGVTLTLTPPGQAYPMALVGADQYRATVPGTDVTQDADLVVAATCGMTTTETTVGHVNLYDPSGTVTDAATGQPVPGATVTLYQVPGWEPKTGPGDDRPDTCQSNASKEPDAPWSQPAPTELGVVVNPEITTLEPALSYQFTSDTGDYGWDVGEGCWYVQVTADGYRPLTSPVVGVPPEVTDLDLALMSHYGVALAPDRAGSADPGRVVTYTHVLSNTGVSSDTYDLEAASSQGWPVALGGLYPGETAHLPWPMNAGMTATILVSVTVPSDAISGTLDLTVVTATSRSNAGIYASATDRTTVNQVPGVALAPDRAGNAKAGHVVTYTHVLTNTGNGPDAFDLEAASSQGWPVALGGLSPGGTAHLPWPMNAGMTATILVSVAVPGDVSGSTVNTTTVTATSQSDAGVYASVADRTTVTEGGYFIYLPLVLKQH